MQLGAIDVARDIKDSVFSLLAQAADAVEAHSFGVHSAIERYFFVEVVYIGYCAYFSLEDVLFFYALFPLLFLSGFFCYQRAYRVNS